MKRLNIQEANKVDIKSRNVISNKVKKQLLSKLQYISDDVQNLIPKHANIERVITNQYTLYIRDGKPILFEFDNRLIPTIFSIREYNITLPKVVVDIGAIRFVVNGADIMAPGIVYFEEEITKDDIVAVHEEKASSVIAVGISLIDAEEFKTKKSGKVIRNIHHLKDKIWGFTP